MAVINTETLDNRKRVQYFIKTRQGGLQQLPFELVTIDHDFQAYEPIDLTTRDLNHRLRRGQLAGVVILDRNVSLPQSDGRTPQEQFGVFQCSEA